MISTSATRVIALIAFSLVSVRASGSFHYECRWTCRASGVPVPTTHFDFELSVDEGEWVLSGTDSMENLKCSVLLTVVSKKHIVAELIDRMTKSKSWNLFAPGEVIELSNDMQSDLLCVVQTYDK